MAEIGYRSFSKGADWPHAKDKIRARPALRKYRFNGARTSLGTGRNPRSHSSEWTSYK